MILSSIKKFFWDRGIEVVPVAPKVRNAGLQIEYRPGQIINTDDISDPTYLANAMRDYCSVRITH